MLIRTVLPALLLFLPHSRAPDETIRVVVVGTFHMGAAADALNPVVENLLGERRQAEVFELVERLADFQPTRIAIEAQPDSSVANEGYEQFLLGQLEPGMDERQQVAYRLAEVMEHIEVFGVDHDQPIDLQQLHLWARRNGQAKVAADLVSAYAEIASRWGGDFMSRSTLTEIYRAFNSEEVDAASHELFISALRLGTEKEPVGADLLSRWYDRNLRIASNVVRLAEPGDRILLLIGANHRRLLTDFLDAVPEVEVVDTLDILGES